MPPAVELDKPIVMGLHQEPVRSPIAAGEHKQPGHQQDQVSVPGEYPPVDTRFMEHNFRFHLHILLYRAPAKAALTTNTAPTMTGNKTGHPSPTIFTAYPTTVASFSFYIWPTPLWGKPR